MNKPIIFLFSIGILCLFTGMFFYVKSLPLNQKRSHIYQQLSKMESENQRLIYELETLKRYEHLEDKALKQLNMIPSKTTHYIPFQHVQKP